MLTISSTEDVHAACTLAWPAQYEVAGMRKAHLEEAVSNGVGLSDQHADNRQIRVGERQLVHERLVFPRGHVSHRHARNRVDNAPSSTKATNTKVAS